jgi:chitin disaccharide deacetylase
MTRPLRRIWLCADDYGISSGVSDAIRRLIADGRLNATSVMVHAPGFDAEAAARLDALRAQAAIGLHVTLTSPFRPATDGFRPLQNGAFPPIGSMLVRGLLRRLDPASLLREVTAQFEAFRAAFGRPPDFVDGHQHVHHVPQVRDAVLAATTTHAPDAWVRQCGSKAPLAVRLRDRKALVLGALAAAFRRKAAARGIATNPAFAGTYDFQTEPRPDFASLFPSFLEGLPSGGLIMCHPGFVDETLRRLDPLTDQREREYAFLASPDFPALLHRHGVELAAIPA